jgi:3',5'-nucleoside bisphosphate phosphatase
MNKETGAVDFHIHSRASDGTLTPQDIIQNAIDLKLKAISITDHDTVEGCREALTLGIPPALKFLTGIEISAKPPLPFNVSGSFHILGYNINIYNLELNSALSILQEARKNRTPKIIKRLNELGKNISIEDIEAEASGKLISRLHIAKALIKKGYISSITDAFNSYIGTNAPAYVEKEKLSYIDAIALIKNSGGIPVLAHPYLLDLQNDELRELISLLSSIGLQGIEVFYSEHTKEQTDFYCKLAQDFNLKKTGGSDFHGANKPDIKMGVGKGSLFVDFKLYEELLKSEKKNQTAKIKIDRTRMHNEDIGKLEDDIGYHFNNKNLLEEALNHSSFAYECGHDIKNNERLEFLGDAVLNLATAHILMEEYSDLSEGMLTQIRAGMVKESILAKIAKKINLGAYIRFGKGEILSKGWEKPSILEDAFESLIAAIYLDAGISKAFEFIRIHFFELIKKKEILADDYKTRLQQFTQEIFKTAPSYEVINTNGPKHKKSFTVKVMTENFSAKGIGDSKKKAEQEAAYNMLNILEKSDIK